MCGIAGILSPNLKVLSSIFAMTAVQAHRGPDGQGHVFLSNRESLFSTNSNKIAQIHIADPCLAMGHRRLAIIDCTDAGRQPMSINNDQLWITYNGEVYNYIELREELASNGFRFRSATDSEVVLAAYHAWGPDCFARFNGMWALAIWDARKNQLILSRDRFGIKPLHYHISNKAVVFSSEIKGILATGLLDAKLNLENVVSYLKWAWVNQNNSTFFKGITAFPPGHYATIDPACPEAIEPVAFWGLNALNSHNTITEEPHKTFRELFTSAVALRMRSDVPVGSCLSGGLDSSAIVCTAAKMRINAQNQFNTFTSCAHDSRFDESPWANLVVDAIHANPHRVYPAEDRFIHDLDQLLWHQEEPFTTASIYAQWLVMQAAKKIGVPVLLDGQGADEVLCGYRKYLFMYLKELAFKRQWHDLMCESFFLLLNGDRTIFNWREGLRYLPSIIQKNLSSMSQIIKPCFLSSWQQNRMPLEGCQKVQTLQLLDIAKYSIPSLLRYEDRNSMAWSIESRVPFLDYRLVEFLLTLPTEYKIRRGRTKAVLRQALRGIVPDAILDRRDKVGFVTPQDVWMKRRLSRLVAKRFNDKEFRLGKFLQQKKLVACFNDFLTNQRSLPSRDFFRIFILDAWMECFNVTP